MTEKSLIFVVGSSSAMSQRYNDGENNFDTTYRAILMILSDEMVLCNNVKSRYNDGTKAIIVKSSNYHTDFLTPGSRPARASSLKTMRLMFLSFIIPCL